jgi:Dual specificity phosphatase, catalytic domain
MQMIRPWLAIGSFRDRQDLALLRANQIGAMLQLAGQIEHPGITSLYLPIEDGEPVSQGTLARGVAFVLAQRAAGVRVLVACGAGISRSTTFAIAALKQAEGLALLDAAREVRRLHPDGMPHHALWASLCAHYREPVSYLDLVRGRA